MRKSRDIHAEVGTEQPRLRAPLVRIEASLVASVFDVLPGTPFFVKNRTLAYVIVNQAMVQLCGASRKADLIGATAAKFFPPGLSEHYEALDRHVLRSGESVTERLEVSGAVRARPTWLLFSRFPIVDRGNVMGVFGVARRLAAPDGRHPKYARLAAMTRMLRQQFAAPLKISALASAAGVSSSQLERDFQQVFGITPQQFQQKMRIEHALRLLKSTRSIADIAHSCGFTDHSAFTRRFKESAGITPTQYRVAERLRAG